MKKGAEWVPFYRSLRSGEKRGLPRAVRFVYLELSMEARSYGGALPLPRGFKNDIDAVHDILGGKRSEIVDALTLLTVPADPSDPSSEPMIALSGPPGARFVTILAHQKYVSADYSTPRVHEHRARRSEEEHEVTPSDGVSSDSEGGGYKKREEKKREEEKKEDHSVGEGARGRASQDPIEVEPSASQTRIRKVGPLDTRIAEDWEPSPTDLEFAHKRGVDGAALRDKFVNHYLGLAGKDGLARNWSAKFRTWVLKAIEFGTAPKWSPKPRLPPRREEPLDLSDDAPSTGEGLTEDLFTSFGKVMP